MSISKSIAAADLSLDRRSLLSGVSLLGLGLAASSLPAFGAEVPKKGGTLRLGMEGGSPSDSLDPRTYADSIPIAMSLMLWNYLVEIADDGSATGELFESWDVKPGATDWTFNIRKGITFTSGKTLDADDVIYSLNIHRGETKSPAKALLVDIIDIKKISPNQIQILMSKGNVDLPYTLGDYHLIVVPDGFTDWTKPDGTAAFTMEEFQPGVRFVAKRKPGYYWKPNRGHFDRVELRYINDASARTNALTSGQVDAINRVDPRIAALLAKSKSIRLSRTPGAGNRFAFAAQTDKSPYTNKDLMLSLKYGIDRQKIVDNVFSGYASIGNDHTVGTRMKYYDAHQKQTPYDPDKARYHFKKSGYGGAMELHVSEGAFSGATDSAQIFQESLSKSGITLDLKRDSSDGYWDNIWLKVPFCTEYWGNRPTIDTQLTISFFGGLQNPWNETHFVDDEFNKLLVSARVELDTKKRADMYARCQELISQRSGMVCFAIQDYLDACSNKLKGLTVSGRYDLADQRIAEKGWFA